MPPLSAVGISGLQAGEDVKARDQRLLALVDDWVDQAEASLVHEGQVFVIPDDPDWLDIPPVLRRGTD